MQKISSTVFFVIIFHVFIFSSSAKLIVAAANTYMIRDAEDTRKRKASTVVFSSVRAASHVVRKPFRDISFWGKALGIYGSYKLSQARARVTRLRKILARKKNGATGGQSVQEIIDESWAVVHEANSKKMMNLCLSLRGFYLKTGQFLGTRHDFMPQQYTNKLSKLHDDVPPLGAAEIKKVLERELGGPIESFFDELDLEKPIGSASVAQVHVGIWKKTGEKCAVKVQYPNAERLMVGDLKNLRFLAEFLQKTELKFDILSAIKELQKQIKNEFDFVNEAHNMEAARIGLFKSVPEVEIPRPIFTTKRALVMTFIEGDNISKLAEFKNRKSPLLMAPLLQKHFGTKLLTTLAKAWGEQIFELRAFNADPHPGNICISKRSRKIGLLDWGQVKHVSDTLAVDFSNMVLSMNSNQRQRIITAFKKLGVELSNPDDLESVEGIALTMLDTRNVPGFVIDPFNPLNALKKNSVTKMPSELYFVVRTVQLLRGIAFAFGIDYSLAKAWGPYAERTLAKHGGRIPVDKQPPKLPLLATTTVIGKDAAVVVPVVKKR